MNKPLILVIEDDKAVRTLITTTLKAHDYRFVEAVNGESAILAATSHNPDIILLDLGLPDMDGVDSLPECACGRMCPSSSSLHEARIPTKSVRWTPAQTIT